MRSLVLVFLLSGVSLLGAVSTAHAQLLPTENLTLLITPEYPRPYDTISITPKSNQINLSASEVVVYENGKVIEKGSGERRTYVTLGGPGSQTTIRVTATSEGQTYEVEVRLRPADVSLVIEPTTTTHPLYRGSALPVAEGPLRIVALADFRNSSGTRVPSGALSYTWRLGNKILTQESGLGRSVLTATAPVQFRDADVSVTVSTSDDSMTAQASVEVTPTSPVAYVYRADPLLGIDIAHRLSGSFPMLSEEETFEVVPFYFSGPPSISWTLNQNPAGTQNSLTVRTENSGSGTALAGFVATGPQGESAQGSFGLTFNNQSAGIFGF